MLDLLPAASQLFGAYMHQDQDEPIPILLAQYASSQHWEHLLDTLGELSVLLASSMTELELARTVYRLGCDLAIPDEDHTRDWLVETHDRLATLAATRLLQRPGRLAELAGNPA